MCLTHRKDTHSLKKILVPLSPDGEIMWYCLLIKSISSFMVKLFDKGKRVNGQHSGFLITF